MTVDQLPLPALRPSHSSDTLRSAGGARALDQFSFFFAFYGLILGLAVAELLSGFAGMVRARALKQLEPQTALLALLTFVIICATWIDAWVTERSVTLDFAGLWAPILIGTAYYLAASIIFPRDVASYAELGTYYADRKRFVVGLLLIGELLIGYTYRATYLENFVDHPVVFWLWTLPYKLGIVGCWVALWFVRSRRANIALLSILLLLFAVGYWQYMSIRDVIARDWGL